MSEEKKSEAKFLWGGKYCDVISFDDEDYRIVHKNGEDLEYHTCPDDALACAINMNEGFHCDPRRTEIYNKWARENPEIIESTEQLNSSWLFHKPIVEYLSFNGTSSTMAKIYKLIGGSHKEISEFCEHMNYLLQNFHLIHDPDILQLYHWLKTLVRDLTLARHERAMILNYDIELHNWYHGSGHKVAGYKVHQWKNRKQDSGYIYIVKGLYENPTYKIGYSKTPKKRIHKFDVVLPFPIKVIHLIPTNHMRAVEAYFHDRYSSKRVNGEWFQLSEQDVADICKIEVLNAEDIS